MCNVGGGVRKVVVRVDSLFDLLVFRYFRGLVRNVIGRGGLVGPKILRDGLRRNWAIVGCEETIEYFFKDV